MPTTDRGNKMYKVLALDLDGTVLTDDHSIHPEVKSAIMEAKHKCHVVIVTGRHHTAARPYYDELGLTTPIICCNGTYVYDYHNDQVLKHNSIDKEDALTFIALAKEFQVRMVMYVTDAMTYSNYNPITICKRWKSGPKRPPNTTSRRSTKSTHSAIKFVTRNMSGNLWWKGCQARLNAYSRTHGSALNLTANAHGRIASTLQQKATAKA
ncbi:HAD-IIB family hydrolase [Vibrio vulnificus]